MEQLFETLKYDSEFRVDVVMFLRKTLQTTHVNYEQLRLNPFPYRLAEPNEVLLKFGDMVFSCKILGPGNYQFT